MCAPTVDLLQMTRQYVRRADLNRPNSPLKRLLPEVVQPIIDYISGSLLGDRPDIHQCGFGGLAERNVLPSGFEKGKFAIATDEGVTGGGQFGDVFRRRS